MNKALTLGRIPLKNLGAHPVRTVILLFLTLAQAACVFSGLTMMRGMRQELEAAEARLGADILIYPSAAMSKISSKTLLMQALNTLKLLFIGYFIGVSLGLLERICFR